MTIETPETFDVIVVGAGNAATCAALSAREAGARVLMLEAAPEEQRGGNSAFTGGAFRIVYHGAGDLARLIPDLNETELNDVDFGTYTEEQYFDDMGRLTQYRCDPDLTEILIRNSPNNLSPPGNPQVDDPDLQVSDKTLGVDDSWLAQAWRWFGLNR